jgi:hypothetical protein
MIELGFYGLRMPKRNCEAGSRLRGERRGRDQVRRSRRRVSPLLLHYHIFKNAGTSFEWAVTRAWGPHRVGVCDTPQSDGIISGREIIQFAKRKPGTRAIFSHQALLPPPRIAGREMITTILIRDPIARIRSIYEFERRQLHASPGGSKAKELEFRGYVEWRLSCSPAMFCNYQVYFCARTAGTKCDETTTEAHLYSAIENLELIRIVGTVDRYAEWLALAQAILVKQYHKLDLRVTRENATASDINLSPAAIHAHLSRELGMGLADRLIECNELDMRLHHVADALLTRRLAEQGVSVPLLNAYRVNRFVQEEESPSENAPGQ